MPVREDQIYNWTISKHKNYQTNEVWGGTKLNRNVIKVLGRRREWKLYLGSSKTDNKDNIIQKNKVIIIIQI